MFLIEKQIEIDMGHRVPGHTGHCRHLHGHRWRIVATVRSDEVVRTEGVSNEGMVADFGVIKRAMMEALHAVYDHRFVVYADDPIRTDLEAVAAAFGERTGGLSLGVVVVPCIPTSEELARLWYHQLAELLEGDLPFGHHLTKLTVWETPNSKAEYTAPQWER